MVAGKSECKCNSKYVGNGRTCQLASECVANEDCVENSQCVDGVCECLEGYERDPNDKYEYYNFFVLVQPPNTQKQTDQS